LAQDSAGRFLTVVGDVRIMGRDGAARPAERGADLREGETIVTGSNALAQLRMADGAQMSVRPDTEMKLDRFSYAGSEDRQPSFLASIVKGGLRVITGLMARQNRAGYAIRTPSATMGVRGTHFELVHVLQPQPELLAGTYNRVYDGVTSIQNQSGQQLLVNRDQTAFIALPGNIAPTIVVPPPAIFSRPTPIPGVTQGPRPEHKGEQKSLARPGLRQPPVTTITPSRTLVNPLDTPTTLQTAPTLTSPTLTAPTTTTISPTLISPTLDTSTTTIKLDTSTTTIRLDTTTTLTAPTTTTTTTSPTLLNSTTTLTAPLTTTTTTTTTTTSPLLSPTLTSPILTSPTTTTIK
jgi:hypothetical protein